MKRLNHFMTSDGKISPSLALAEEHAKARAGRLHCEIAKEMTALTNYTDALQYLEHNLHKFLELDELNKDILIEESTSA